MKDPMRLIDRFCYRHPNFGIPNLMRYLTIANVVFWILGTANATLLSYLSFDAALILRGQIWRLFTFMVYPPSMGMLAFLVFYFYYWMGSTLEQYWGTPQFNVYLLIGWCIGYVIRYVGHGVHNRFAIAGACFTLMAIIIGDTIAAIGGISGIPALLSTPAMWGPLLELWLRTYLSTNPSSLLGLLMRCIGIYLAYHYSVIL